MTDPEPATPLQQATREAVAAEARRLQSARAHQGETLDALRQAMAPDRHTCNLGHVDGVRLGQQRVCHCGRFYRFDGRRWRPESEARS